MQVSIASDGIMPKKGTSNSAGFDLYSPISFKIFPKTIITINTKLKIAVPAGTYAQIYSRSGMAIKGVIAIAGTIDADYRGYVIVALHNLTNETQSFESGTRIAQLVLHKINYEPAIQWTFLPDDESAAKKECLPIWYVNNVRSLLMEEIRAIGQYNNLENKEQIDFTKFINAKNNYTKPDKNNAIKLIRGSGGFGSTGQQ